MVRVIYILFLVLLSEVILSQNLVPNSSFEKKINDFKSGESGWIKCLKSDTPDYFNFDSISKDNVIFDKYLGNIQPRSGNGFIGLFFYRKHKTKNSRNIREYVQARLIEPLQKDSVYDVEYYVCLDVESNIALHDFGIYFSKEMLFFKNDMEIFKIKPQIQYLGNSVSEKYKWTKISGQFKAQGNEKYIIIGSFTPDKKLKRMRLKNNFNNETRMPKWDTENSEFIAYYYIDDVSVHLAQKKIIEEIIPDEITDQYDIEEIKVDTIIVLKNILFEFDKAEIQSISYKELNKLLILLQNNPNLKIDIYGHTDKKGTEEYNYQLSESRAKAVFNYLVENGIDASRLSYKGFGSIKPITENESENGRKYNRRVEFKVVDK